jgi:hypothetical protein
MKDGKIHDHFPIVPIVDYIESMTLKWSELSEGYENLKRKVDLIYTKWAPMIKYLQKEVDLLNQ